MAMRHMGETTVEEELAAREYDWRDTSPSMAVINTVATIESVDSVDLRPLYEYIDPNSLDAVIASGDDVSLSFSAYGYTVTIVGSTVIIRTN